MSEEEEEEEEEENKIKTANKLLSFQFTQMHTLYKRTSNLLPVWWHIVRSEWNCGSCLTKAYW